MNHYFRLLSMFIRHWLGSKTHQNPTDDFVISLRALPLDCDANMHLTNSRYFSFGDLGRIDMMLKTKLGSVALQKRWLGVVNAQSVTYIRPIKPMSKIELHSKLLGWDEKYWYFEHRFIANRTLYASILVRGVFLKGKKPVPMSELLGLVDYTEASPELPLRVIHWKQLLSTKKQESPALA
ncbi:MULTISPECIES: acyl-CoA thioesterase [unclassified Agarivorans]|uniref:acyl-CoA thioesterase n=1 Tax=unclassified Agarivorans TaxID=2636026 RepID=UPI0026E3382A|nr:MULTISPECIES: acyl-CoA thioesterase [unclassified Agarivorans]MDO6684447.1 acyl-CoA thioesterase [Agarivorans sp. 3_MG-2023]MDO6714612.1 acyl-CoA thioesterase [Agarivorans sp. 2_MG-2023]